jgi:HSP20 family protein
MDVGRDALAAISEDLWLARQEGQLSVDVVETDREIIVRSAVAGVRSADLDIALTADTLTIRGERALDCQDYEDGVIHLAECYWGTFSRSIVLPHPVKPNEADAEM